MPAPSRPDPLLHQVDRLAREVATAGADIGFAYVAASADIGSPRPMTGSDGAPFAETAFRWIDPDLQYWKDRAFALRAAFVHAARTCAEPFYFHKETLGSWREIAALEAINRNEAYETFGVKSAIVAPVHAPGGAIGAVVWASDREMDVAPLFWRHAEHLQALALRFVSTYRDALAAGPRTPAVHLTRREIQCLKWAAAGKTDAEIATIIEISVPTVRFHVTNAARKLGVSGKGQAIRCATILGYVGHEA